MGAGPGIVSWGWYLPRFRMERAQLGAVLHTDGGTGSRSVASYDEDTVTMGVEAARRALCCVEGPGVAEPGSLWFATTRPPYLDKTNATAIAAACDLPDALGAYDVAGSIRSGIAALRAAAADRNGGLAVLSDLRMGRPGSVDESRGGDGAAAFLFGSDPAAEVLACASVSDEFLDRWRSEGDVGARAWDERWSADIYLPLIERVANDVLKASGLSIDDIDHAVVSCSVPRVTRQFSVKLSSATRTFDPAPTAGYLGAADIGIQLAAALERSAPGEHILVVLGADGADAMVLRTTDAVAQRRTGHAPERATGLVVDPVTYLTWRGVLDREPPRRPEPEAPASPASARNERWKFAFVGSRCDRCGTRHLPPQRVCMSCGSADRMTADPVSSLRATVRNFTVDHLAYSPAPPSVVSVVDFDGGGRYRCQLTDVVPEEVVAGSRVEMVFRLVSVSGNGIRNYFWKARPIVEEEP
jgi:hydroxymethylglutaryl-CoA synthase